MTWHGIVALSIVGFMAYVVTAGITFAIITIIDPITNDEDRKHVIGFSTIWPITLPVTLGFVAARVLKPAASLLFNLAPNFATSVARWRRDRRVPRAVAREKDGSK